MDERLIIGITMGDPASIGPEITVKALADKGIYDKCRPLVIGDANVMEAAVKIVGKEDIKIHPVHSAEEALFEAGTIDVYDMDLVDMDKLERGKISVMAGEAAFRYVEKVIQIRFASSVWLMAAAWILSGVAGVILGMAAGARKGSLADRVISAYALVTASTPAFWVALVLLMVFAVWLKVLPVGLSVPIGADAAAVSIADRIRHGILPAAALSLTGISNITLHTREKMIQVMESDYVLFARARGESLGSIVFRHGLRNMILPALTLQFASISEIFGGSVLVEQVFSYPGLGQAAVSAGLGSDIPLLMGITMISAAIVFAGNFIADILYEIIDPRMRKNSQKSK